MINIHTCPFCDKKSIQCKKRTLIRKVGKRQITIPNTNILECSNCGERLFDSQTMDYIESHIYLKTHKRKKS